MSTLSKKKSKTKFCDYRGCHEEGLYKAPKDNSLSDSYWFCLKHVKEYNKNWNYYRDYNEEEMEAAIRADTIWQRATHNFGAKSYSRKSFYIPKDVAAALAMFKMELPYTKKELREKYKILAKEYHPDANAGDKYFEEKFKKLTQNYKILLEFL